jgi:hypothetical protein
MSEEENLSISKMIDRKLEIEALVAAIEQNLLENGYMVGDTQAPTNVQNGIRINGELSFRGCEKAEELFDRLDEYNMNFLTYTDIRGIIL